MTIKSYEDLKAWQCAMALLEKTYHVTENFPKKEVYRLVDQMCRAAVSIPSNIAEGSMRHSTRDFVRFIGIAQGSLAELETQIMIASRLKYIDDVVYHDTFESAQEVGRLLSGLYVALRKKIEASETLATSH